MIEIDFNDVENSYFDRDNLDIKICFSNKNSVVLHFDSLNEYRMYRDYIIDCFIC